MFENSQNMRFEVADVLPLVVKKQGTVEDKIPSYLKNIEAVKDDVSDLDSFEEKNEVDSFEEKNEEYNMDITTVSYSDDDDDEVEYLGTKEVPDITLVKVVPANKPYVDKDQKSDESNSNTVTLM